MSNRWRFARGLCSAKVIWLLWIQTIARGARAQLGNDTVTGKDDLVDANGAPVNASLPAASDVPEDTQQQGAVSPAEGPRSQHDLGPLSAPQAPLVGFDLDDMNGSNWRFPGRAPMPKPAEPNPDSQRTTFTLGSLLATFCLLCLVAVFVVHRLRALGQASTKERRAPGSQASGDRTGAPGEGCTAADDSGAHALLAEGHGDGAKADKSGMPCTALQAALRHVQERNLPGYEPAPIPAVAQMRQSVNLPLARGHHSAGFSPGPDRAMYYNRSWEHPGAQTVPIPHPHLCRRSEGWNGLRPHLNSADRHTWDFTDARPACVGAEPFGSGSWCQVPAVHSACSDDMASMSLHSKGCGVTAWLPTPVSSHAGSVVLSPHGCAPWASGGLDSQPGLSPSHMSTAHSSLTRMPADALLAPQAASIVLPGAPDHALYAWVAGNGMVATGLPASGSVLSTGWPPSGTSTAVLSGDAGVYSAQQGMDSSALQLQMLSRTRQAVRARPLAAQGAYSSPGDRITCESGGDLVLDLTNLSGTPPKGAAVHMSEAPQSSAPGPKEAALPRHTWHQHPPQVSGHAAGAQPVANFARPGNPGRAPDSVAASGSDANAWPHPHKTTWKAAEPSARPPRRERPAGREPPSKSTADLWIPQLTEPKRGGEKLGAPGDNSQQSRGSVARASSPVSRRSEALPPAQLFYGQHPKVGSPALKVSDSPAGQGLSSAKETMAAVPADRIHVDVEVSNHRPHSQQDGRISSLALSEASASSAGASGAVPFAAAVEQQLDRIEKAGDGLILGKYKLEGTQERRKGSQAVVAFVRDRRQAGRLHAIKFTCCAAAFERERDAIGNPALGAVMAAYTDVVHDHKLRHSAAAGLLPPMIITERGENLKLFMLKHDPDYFAAIQVIVQLASMVASVHRAGRAHRNIKPGNCIWLPSQSAWGLIDFGSCAPIGTDAPLALSLLYAAPETVSAFVNGQSNVVVHAGVDVFALGIMSFELLMRTPFYPPGVTGEVVGCMLAGEIPMPHESAAKVARRRFGKFEGMLNRMLARDPSQRATADDVLRWYSKNFDSSRRLATKA